MKKSCVFIAALLLMGSASTARAGDVPQVIQPAFIIHASDEHEFTSKQGGETNYQIWAWWPHAILFVDRAIPSGGNIEIEYTTGNGKPWLTLPCRDGGSNGIDCGGQSGDVPNHRYSRDTGAFGFKVHYKNELDSTSEVIFQGTFTVNKYFDGRTDPSYKQEDKDCFEFYVDYDWAIPLGFVAFATGQGYGAEPMKLRVWSWFKFGAREPASTSELEAHVFYKGREVCKGHGIDGDGFTTENIDTDDASKRWGWSRRFFYLDLCQAASPNPDGQPDAFQMDKNPGEYEVKVLMFGKLVRTATFTVNADGKITNPLGEKNPQLRTSRALLPMQIIGDQDYKIDRNAWKTSMFFGNKLIDFIAP